MEPSLLDKNVLKPGLLAVGLPVSTPARGDAPAEKGVRLHDYADVCVMPMFPRTPWSPGVGAREVSA